MTKNYMTEADTLRFKMYMVGAGYNITSLSKEVGMTRESLASRINGKVDFGRKEMMKISELFRTNPAQIFSARKLRKTQPKHLNRERRQTTMTTKLNVNLFFEGLARALTAQYQKQYPGLKVTVKSSRRMRRAENTKSCGRRYIFWDG